jgi:alpha-tubulin suppressor-like RCC1 family protein
MTILFHRIKSGTSRRHAAGFWAQLILAALAMSCAGSLFGAGLNWPTNQLLPTFSRPASVLDCIDVSAASNAEIDLFASLEGIVNRTQPQIACVSSGDGEGKFTWLNVHNLPYNLTNGYGAILKYRSYLAGLVVTDPNQPDTLNLATTIAGVNNQLICDPSLLATLTNAPYNLPVGVDLRGMFANQYQVYGYLYTNYWPQCTHRIITGLYTNLHGNLRDYCVAVKSAVVWLDPGTLNFSDKATLGLYLGNMIAAQSLYMGWWPNEGNGLGWIAQYGVPVLASDWFRNGSVFSGISQPINVPDIPPPPPLQNKVYVSLILSDGDNIQYMQHVMKMWWGNTARGSIPLGWTATPLAAEMDPMLFNYYWSTATTNDCLISGPCGAGYTHMESWSAANLAAYARLSDSYLQRSGLRVITIWDSVSSGIAQAFATNCPTLLGLTSQSGGTYTSVNLGLRTMGLTVTYSSATSAIISGLTNAASTWNGTAPMFLAAQADTWNLTPSDMVTIANALDTNKYVLVRPDHLFMLYNRVFGLPQAVTESALITGAGSATLRGMVTPNATNAVAWMEWGTNSSYGSKSAVTNVGLVGTVAPVTKAVSGLVPRQVYHYRVVSSNALGMAWGADRQFTTGGRLKVWGNTTLGETNVPAGMTNVVGIAAGANHGLGLRNDGTVAAWGSNAYGQTNVPAGLSNVVQVVAGQYHSLALKADGTIIAWGNNTYGQTNVPAGLSNVVAIAAGAYHNLALKADQTVTAWGYNSNGQTNVPAGLANVVDISAGQFHSLALKADGMVRAWGLNNLGQTNVPAAMDHVLAVAAGQSHSLALKANGLATPNLFPASKWVADSISGTNGTLVVNWTESVLQKNATQASASNQPQLVTNAINGHSVVRFAGAGSQYLTVATNDSPISGATDFTLVIVFQTTIPGLVSSLFYQNTGLLGGEQPFTVADWALGLNGSQLGAGLGAGNAGCGSDVSLYGGNVTDGKPHIALYARSGIAVRLYVDGVIVAEQTSLCTAARGNYSFQIGAMTTTTGFYTGDIAEIQLYNRALAAWEIVSLDKVLAATYGMAGVAGAPMAKWVADSLSGSDGSSVSNWTDVFGNKTAAQTNAARQPKLYSNSMNGHKVVRFANASSQYLTVTATNSPIAGAGSFTLVMVFKTTTAGAASSSFYNNTGLLGAEQIGVLADWALCINGSQLGAGLGSGANGCGADLSLYGGTVTDGNPHVAMYVRAGDTVSLYVDGARVAAQSSLCPAERGDYSFQIGAMLPGSLCFNGDIAEIQLYNRALNSGELLSANEALAATYGINGAAGAVVVWGSNANGQANVPKNLTNVTAVAAGSAFNLALNANGTVTGWGNNSQGQTNLLPGLTNVAAIAGGTTFGLAIGNQPPSVSNVTVSGYVNHDLALALPVVNPDGNPLNFHILSLPAAGALYQFAGGVRGDPISAPNTLSGDPSGEIIFAPAAGQTGSPYAGFSFMVDDGVFSSMTATVNVNIGLPAVPQFTGAFWNPGGPGGSFNLNFTGDSNATYDVWTSTNLVTWAKIATATEISPGQYQFTDWSVTNSWQQFYRILSGK